MAEPKTKPTEVSVKSFLDGVADPGRKADCQAVLKLMRGLTGAEPVMWGTSVVGFGEYTYTTPGGRTGEWFVLGFSPRKKDLTLYVVPGLSKSGDLLAKLGPHKLGKACLYLNSLADVDVKVLKQVLVRAVSQANGG